MYAYVYICLCIICNIRQMQSTLLELVGLPLGQRFLSDGTTTCRWKTRAAVGICAHDLFFTLS